MILLIEILTIHRAGHFPIFGAFRENRLPIIDLIYKSLHRFPRQFAYNKQRLLYAINIPYLHYYPGISSFVRIRAQLEPR